MNLERKERLALFEGLERVKKSIQKDWVSMAHTAQRVAENPRPDASVRTQAHNDMHAEQAEAGLEHFNELFDKALDALEAGDDVPMKQLFTLANEVCFSQNLLDGDKKDQARFDELASVEYTFLAVDEAHLLEWQRVLQTFMVLDPTRDIVSEYEHRNHENEAEER